LIDFVVSRPTLLSASLPLSLTVEQVRVPCQVVALVGADA